MTASKRCKPYCHSTSTQEAASCWRRSCGRLRNSSFQEKCCIWRCVELWPSGVCVILRPCDLSPYAPFISQHVRLLVKLPCCYRSICFQWYGVAVAQFFNKSDWTKASSLTYTKNAFYRFPICRAPNHITRRLAPLSKGAFTGQGVRDRACFLSMRTL